MSKSTGRFNLRTRKSLKNQLECVSCNRQYFPLECSEDDENDVQTENICCDCDEKRRTESKPKRRAISIKVEHPDPSYECQADQQNTFTNYATRSRNLNPGNMVQIHSIELVKPATAVVNASNIPKIKEEKPDITTKLVKKVGRPKRALQNKTNTMEVNVEDGIDQMKAELDNHHAVIVGMITKNDTIESLRQKFPNVNPFEFEFLLFLKNKSE